jgi:hypothetical protein
LNEGFLQSRCCVCEPRGGGVSVLKIYGNKCEQPLFYRGVLRAIIM